MSGFLNFELAGMKELQTKIQRLSTLGTGVYVAPHVRRGADQVAKFAAQIAPARTGHLRGSIQVAPMKFGPGYCWFKVMLAPDAWYGWFQEFGLGTKKPGGPSARVLRRQANYEQSVWVRRQLVKVWKRTGRGVSLVDVIAGAGLSRREQKRQRILAKGGYLQGERRPNMAARPFMRPSIKWNRESVIALMVSGIAGDLMREAT